MVNSILHQGLLCSKTFMSSYEALLSDLRGVPTVPPNLSMGCVLIDK